MPRVQPSLFEDQPDQTLDEFDSFWGPYPRKVGKETARRAWLRLDLHARARAVEGARGMREAWEGADPSRLVFCPHPASWLNGRRWTDDREDWKRTARGYQREPVGLEVRRYAASVERPAPKPKVCPPHIAAIGERIRNREAVPDDDARLYGNWLENG